MIKYPQIIHSSSKIKYQLNRFAH